MREQINNIITILRDVEASYSGDRFIKERLHTAINRLKELKKVKPQSGLSDKIYSKVVKTFVLAEPFHDDWYDVGEFNTLDEVMKEYDKKPVAAIMEKQLNVSIILKKGKIK